MAPRLTRRQLLALGRPVGAALAFGGAAHFYLRDRSWDGNESYWLTTVEDVPGFEAVSGDRRADLVVVGGGFTGLSTALHAKLARPERSVILLEARHLGFGASGRNGGQLRGYTANFELLPGIEDNVRFVLQLIADHGIDCDLVRYGERELYDLNPYKLVLGLARACVRVGVELHEDSRVQAIHQGPRITLEGDDFALECDQLVLGTNAYTPQLGFLRRELFPVHSGVLVTEPLGEAAHPIPVGFSHKVRGGTDYYWGRRTPDERVLFGGGLRYCYDNGLRFSGRERLWEAEQQALARLYPTTEGARIDHAWSGPMGFFLDFNPRLGRSGEHQNLYWGLGYAGMGIAMGLRFGSFLAAWLEGNEPPAWTRRPPIWLPGEPLRYMGVNAALHLVDLGWLRM